jgi:hypothetical protein
MRFLSIPVQGVAGVRRPAEIAGEAEAVFLAASSVAMGRCSSTRGFFLNGISSAWSGSPAAWSSQGKVRFPAHYDCTIQVWVVDHSFRRNGSFSVSDRRVGRCSLRCSLGLDDRFKLNFLRTCRCRQVGSPRMITRLCIRLGISICISIIFDIDIGRR